MIMIEFKWDHLQLCSADAEATAAWFARCLNAEIVRRPGRVDLRIGAVNLFITAQPDARSATMTEGRPVQGIDHFGVLVDDLDAAYAYLVAHDAEIVQPITRIRAGVRGCFVRAPGDILVEVLERRAAEMTFN